MALTTAVLIFDGVAEMDFAAPWEVFNVSKMLGNESDRIFTVSLTDGPVTCLGGLRVIPDYTAATAPQADILIVPGTADPSAQCRNQPLLDWIAAASETSRWTVGICTGTAILAAAGVAEGKRVTTHWQAIDAVKVQHPNVTVLEKVRYVRDGKLLTSAGVSAGLDMALWLLGQLHDPQHAREIQHILEYYPAPPYAAEV